MDDYGTRRRYRRKIVSDLAARFTIQRFAIDASEGQIVIQRNEDHLAQVLAEPIDHRSRIVMNDDFCVG